MLCRELVYIQLLPSRVVSLARMYRNYFREKPSSRIKRCSFVRDLFIIDDVIISLRNTCTSPLFLQINDREREKKRDNYKYIEATYNDRGEEGSLSIPFYLHFPLSSFLVNRPPPRQSSLIFTRRVKSSISVNPPIYTSERGGARSNFRLLVKINAVAGIDSASKRNLTIQCAPSTRSHIKYMHVYPRSQVYEMQSPGIDVAG